MFSNFSKKFEPLIEQYNSSGDLMLQRYSDDTLTTGLWRLVVQNTLLLRYPAVKSAFRLNTDLALPLDYPDSSAAMATYAVFTFVLCVLEALTLTSANNATHLIKKLLSPTFVPTARRCQPCYVKFHTTRAATAIVSSDQFDAYL
jgi:hypothetical protein